MTKYPGKRKQSGYCLHSSVPRCVLEQDTHEVLKEKEHEEEEEEEEEGDDDDEEEEEKEKE
ncbi:hypothetical protein E2C01_100317 [Portunus trituberculatus]|uniref:Uncharacterized protein n=1 Tax=Portunus trituberculatus TaxID=210409 RepID=A0A5B7KBR1_PORTR|nr:hypothetical protein [Portunus trituberculatus]